MSKNEYDSTGANMTSAQKSHLTQVTEGLVTTNGFVWYVRRAAVSSETFRLLLEQGLIMMRRNPGEPRGQEVVLTDAGRAALKELKKGQRSSREYIPVALERLTSTQRYALAEVADGLVATEYDFDKDDLSWYVQGERVSGDPYLPLWDADLIDVPLVNGMAPVTFLTTDVREVWTEWWSHHPERHIVGDGNSEEIRITSASGGQKGSKPARYDLIPAGPLDTVARLYGKGAEKYEDRNWERGYEWSLSFAALNRHLWAFWSGIDNDEETGLPHMASVAWHALALMEFMEKHPDLDDRP